jgi:CDGSH-type Zn-finger protein
MTPHEPTCKDRHSRAIKIVADGPYVVTGGVPLMVQAVYLDEAGQPHGWDQGRTYPRRESYALCRCGHSQDPPYCDGSHAPHGFDGTETAGDLPYADQAERTEGPTLDLSDAPIFCANAGFCERDGGTWELTRESDAPESRRLAVEQACECPSGRLVAFDKGGRPIEPDFEPSIGVVEGPGPGDEGPLWVRGGISIMAADGSTYEARNRVTLCRCGRSMNKPFCDGNHVG